MNKSSCGLSIAVVLQLNLSSIRINFFNYPLFFTINSILEHAGIDQCMGGAAHCNWKKVTFYGSLAVGYQLYSWTA